VNALGILSANRGRGGPRVGGNLLDSFAIFWAAQTASVLGDAISFVALPLLVLDASGSVAKMGAVTAVAGISSVLSGIVAGHIVDRRDRRRILIGCDLSRAAALFLVPVVWITGPNLWLVVVVAIIAAAMTMVFQVAYVTAVASLVPSEQLIRANGRLEATYALASTVGPLLGGLLVAQVGADWAVGADGLTFLVSAGALTLVRFRAAAAVHLPREPIGASGADRSPRSDLLVGLRFLWSRDVLRWLTALLGGLTFVTMGAPDLIIFHLRHDLEAGAGTVGLVLAAAGVGSVVAALLTPTLRYRVGFGPCWLGSVVLIGLAVPTICLTDQIPVIAAMSVVFMTGLTVAGICSMSLRQEITPSPLLGRVTSAFWLIHTTPGILGAAALTAGAGAFGVGWMGLAAAGICILVLLIGLASPIRVYSHDPRASPPSD
jgi:MFS family permease